MKFKLFLTKVSCAVLLLCLILSSFACDSQDKGNDSTSETSPTSASETTTAAPTDPAPSEPAAPVSFTLNASYTIVRPDERNFSEVNAVSLLARGIESAYGAELTETTDFLRYGEEINPAEFEILVGPTNRLASQELYSELSYYDWTYKIISPNVIAICGGSPEATLKAAEAFLEDLMGYKENSDKEAVFKGNLVTLTTGTQKNYSHKYSVSSLSIEGRSISEFSIVANNVYADTAAQIVSAFNKTVGIKIPIIAQKDYAGGPAIFLGCASGNGEHLDVPDFAAQRYFIKGEKDSVIIDFKSKAAAAEAAERFIKTYLPYDSAVGNVNITLTGDMISGISVLGGTNELELKSSTSKTVASGITYEQHLYRDPDGLPVRAYVLTVKKGAASFETSMPKDAYGTGVVTNIKNQLTAAQSNGKNVIAGINADFFDRGGTNVMRGLCIKNGRFIHEAAGRPWFGITKDGTPVLGTSNDFSKYAGNLENAVGGSHVILRNGATSDLDIGSDFGDTRHPRTAVGIKSNGDVVLIVVDGRQSATSNGATLADLADILGDMGCSNAVNLDGGGSSTFIMKENGSFNTKNSPSDGGLRSVANGLMVILPYIHK